MTLFYGVGGCPIEGHEVVLVVEGGWCGGVGWSSVGRGFPGEYGGPGVPSTSGESTVPLQTLLTW